MTPQIANLYQAMLILFHKMQVIFFKLGKTWNELHIFSVVNFGMSPTSHLVTLIFFHLLEN